VVLDVNGTPTGRSVQVTTIFSPTTPYENTVGLATVADPLANPIIVYTHLVQETPAVDVFDLGFSIQVFQDETPPV
jgi:hypothetical protein